MSAPGKDEAGRTDDAATLELLEQLRSNIARSRPLMALGALTPILAMILLTLFVFREWQHQTREQRDAVTIAHGEREIAVARANIAALRGTLDDLRKGGDVNQLVSKAINEASEANASLTQAQVLNRTANVPAADLKMITAPPLSPTQGEFPVAPLAGNGWNIDVFWCAGAGQDTNYAIARTAAVLLGIGSAKREMVAPGVSLGRVRLRPVRAQDRWSWPDGNYVTSDGGKGEDDTAKAIAHMLTKNQPIPFGFATSGGKDTPGYLSVFACTKGA